MRRYARCRCLRRARRSGAMLRCKGWQSQWLLREQAFAFRRVENDSAADLEANLSQSGEHKLPQRRKNRRGQALWTRPTAMVVNPPVQGEKLNGPTRRPL